MTLWTPQGEHQPTAGDSEHDIVPWVAMWSAEMRGAKPLQMTPAGVFTTGIEMYGCHFIDYPNAQGTGEPVFGQVHTVRQIRCMKGPRCQVCGERFDKSKPVTWVLNNATDRAVYEHPDAHKLTQTPPVCATCRPAALLRCPHLRERVPIVLSVSEYHIFGVQGDLYLPDGRLNQGAVLPIDHPLMRFMLGRQLVVQLDEYIEVPA